MHTIIDNTLDDDVFEKINRETFMMILEQAGIDLKKMADKRKKNDYIPFHRFNFLLKELHKTKKIDITESCILLMTECYTTKDLMSCLNEENKYILRVSLAERKNIKLKTTTLDIFEKRRKKSS